MLDVKNKKVLVVGLGASGYAAVRLLTRKGAHVKVSENAENEDIKERIASLKGYPVEFEAGRHTRGFFAGADIAVVSPGVDTAALYSRGLLSKKDNVIGELELGFSFCKAPVIAITGTNGKSTTAELVGSILSRSGRHTVVCGNIGNPFSGEVDNLTDQSVAVVEVSSFQLQTIRCFRPHIAVLLNVSEDHLHRHGGYDNYASEKFRIFTNQSGEDWALLHSSLRTDPLSDAVKSRLIFYDAESGAFNFTECSRGPFGFGRKSEVFMERRDMPLRGAHNLDNIACAVLVSRIMGVDDASTREAVMSFGGLAHRFETIGDVNGVEFIDDSKATNIDATRRALESLGKKVLLIAGGIDKGGDYSSIFSLVRDKVKAMVVIGDSRERLKQAFSGLVPVFPADGMKEAVEFAATRAEPGEAVMLSPMCSSFDMFSDYRHRGEAFRSAVKKLKQGFARI